MWCQTGSRVLSLFLITLALLAVTTGSAQAYIDAGTGSLILQILVAGFFGSLFALKVFWGRITSRMSRFLSKFRNSETS